MNVQFRWINRAETDLSDPRGIAIYTMPNGVKIEVPMPSFSTANALYNALHDAFAHAHQAARAWLLAEISRIEP